MGYNSNRTAHIFISVSEIHLYNENACHGVTETGSIHTQYLSIIELPGFTNVLMSIISTLHFGHKKNWFFIRTNETKLLESNKYTTVHAIYQHFSELIEQAVIQLCPNLFLNFPAAAELQVWTLVTAVLPHNTTNLKISKNSIFMIYF